MPFFRMSEHNDVAVIQWLTSYYKNCLTARVITKTDFGAECVQLWVRSTESPWEHLYETTCNNTTLARTRNVIDNVGVNKALSSF